MITITILLPVSGYPFCTFDIVLNGTTYTMQFNYNFRFNFWTFTLIQDGVTLIDNEKIVQGFNLGSQYGAIDTGGIFFVKSLSGDDSDPTLNDFSSTSDKQFFYQYEQD